MCCFSRPVRFVGGTKIFARLEGGRQHLGYAMEIEIDEPLAMVLPLPVVPGSGEDAVRFVSLESCPAFFDDLEAMFPPDHSRAPAARGLTLGLSKKATLPVHRVGLYEASFVPTRSDFERLDARFRLPEGIWDRLPGYEEYGFAVFKLSPPATFLGLGVGGRRQRIHPMAFSFPTRHPDTLFFPTVHVHDGTVPAEANFDHSLYCQPDGVLAEVLGWTPSSSVLGARLFSESTGGLVDGARGGQRATFWASLPNRDVLLAPPEGLTMQNVTGGGPCHRYRILARRAYLPTHDARSRAWHDSAQHRLGQVAAALGPGLGERLSARWPLAPVDDGLPPFFLNGLQLWSGTAYDRGAPAPRGGGPGRVVMEVFTPSVEPQRITLYFSSVPDQAGIDAIRQEIEAILDHAAS